MYRDVKVVCYCLAIVYHQICVYMHIHCVWVGVGVGGRVSEFIHKCMSILTCMYVHVCVFECVCTCVLVRV